MGGNKDSKKKKKKDVPVAKSFKGRSNKSGGKKGK